MKKLLVLLSAFALVAGLSMNAFADACYNCKGDTGRVPFDTSVENQTSVGATCGEFDFDGNPAALFAYPDEAGQSGYCYDPKGSYSFNNSEDLTRERRNQKLIFAICECGDDALQNKLVPYSVITGKGVEDGIGIRMGILTEGVYFAAPNVTVLAQDEFGVNLLDADGNTYDSGYETMIRLSTYRVKNTPSSGTPAGACNALYHQYDAGDATKTFGRVSYYVDADCNSSYAYPADGTSCTVFAGDTSNPISARAKGLQSNRNEGYTITDTDLIGKVSYWWIDVPPMRLDTAVAKVGTFINIKVGLLGDRDGTICQGCVAFCECVFVIGQIGCQPVASSDAIRFPYVVQQTTPWTTGIAVTNLEFGSVPNPAITIHLTDATGQVYTASHTMTGAVEAWDLDELISGTDALAWSPSTSTPAPGFAWICISGNFAMDGYSYLNDGIFGAGTLPREGVTCTATP